VVKRDHAWAEIVQAVVQEETVAQEGQEEIVEEEEIVVALQEVGVDQTPVKAKSHVTTET